MLKLCGFRISNYHNKTRLVLLEKGIEHEEDADCRPRQTEEFLARSPMGKAPFLELEDGRRLSESEVICEYLEDAYPQKPLLPRDLWQRARVRELVTHMELYLELPVRRTYGFVFFGRPVDEQVKQAVEKDLARGVRAFKALAKFDPYIAGPELTLADCAAFVHLPLVSLATKLGYGRDVLEDVPGLASYLQMLGERPAFARVKADAAAARAGAQKK
ncbi:MAG TPA: glutathione S-transferase [Burkholderiales bacterium]|jgi:glutathione S-transferase|nr:glutathione S-transferase [Burkholderiales bacterium]